MSLTTSIRWAALSQASRIGSQIISVTVLARLLSPADYGLLAIATIFTNFAYLFRDLGTGSAIIKDATLREETIDTVFWLNLATGMAIMAAMLLMARPLAAYYEAPGLNGVLSLLAISFPITCASIVHQSLLERNMQFRKLAAFESIAVVLGVCTALAGAWAGWGTYSLVAQILVSTIVQSTLVCWRSGWKPRWRIESSGLRGLLRYSGNVTSFNFVNYFARNADSFIIGKALGTAVLGAYSVAYRLMLFPIQNMSYVASRALFPAMSRLHNEGQALSPVYLKALGAIAFGTAPIMGCLFAVKEVGVAVVMGQHWSGVPQILMWLAPIGFVQSILSTSGAVFMATGRPDLMLRYGAVGSILQVVAFVIGVQWGLQGLTAAYLVATVLNALLTMRAVCLLAGSTAKQLMATVSRPALCALISLAGARIVLTALNQATAVQQLTLTVAFFAAVYLSCSHWMAATQMRTFIGLLHKKTAS